MEGRGTRIPSGNEDDPNFALAHQWYGNDLARQRSFAEALRETRLALKLDPLLLQVRETLAYVYCSPAASGTRSPRPETSLPSIHPFRAPG